MLQGSLETYFAAFRDNIIGHQQLFATPFGSKRIIYADWTASGRAYQPIEDYLQKEIMPFVGNTHTATTVTGTLMSKAYAQAKRIIKSHVNAGKDDVLIFCGSGMTAAVNKLQRILGMRIPERAGDYSMKENCLQMNEPLRPVVFVTQMEHHSNHISWLETIAKIEIIQADEEGKVDLAHLRELLEQYRYTKNKIAAVTACSNVTGIQTAYHDIAKLMHAYGGLCFVDFACSAPYVNIDMHPEIDGANLDAIYFSPHKFLGGTGTPGVLIFHKKIYTNKIPDQPGGGTILYSNPWKHHEYINNVEDREDGGTPPFLQAIKTAMCIKLKEQMCVEKMQQREQELLSVIFTRLSTIEKITILEKEIIERLGIISFIVEGVHHNLIVKILNDRFGIQTRGGCSCAGTYGHFLLNVNKQQSYDILQSIRTGNLLHKPGWVRLSVHPVMTNGDIAFILEAIESTVRHIDEWKRDYTYDKITDEYIFRDYVSTEQSTVEEWFTVDNWDHS